MTVIDKKKNTGEFISTIKCFNLEVTHGHNSSTKISCTVIPSAKMCVCAQCCPAFCDPMDPRLLCHGNFQARILEQLPFPTPRVLPDPGLNPHLFCLLHWHVDSLPLCHFGKPIAKITKTNPFRNQKREEKLICVNTQSLYHSCQKTNKNNSSLF